MSCDSKAELEDFFLQKEDERYSFLRYNHPDLFRRCCEIGWAISGSKNMDSLALAAKAESMAISLAFDIVESLKQKE